MLPLKIEQALCIAHQHFAAGRFADAEGLCRRILRDEPKNSVALHLLGKSIAAIGRPENAIPFLARAVEQQGDSFAVHFDLAKACSAVGQVEQAIAEYRICVRLDPASSAAHAQLGILCAASGLADDALASLTVATTLSPDSAEYHFHLGVAHSNLDSPAQAIAAYERAIELDPSLPEPHANLGMALRQSGQLKRALESYRRAISLNPDCAEVRCNLGVALAEDDQMEVAMECYRQALSIDPDFVNAHFNLGNALRKFDDHERAIGVYRRAVEIRPDFVQAISNMAMSFGDIGHHEMALRAFDRAVELRPEWAEARWNRSLTHLLRGDFQRGWEEFDFRNQIIPPSSRTFPGERWSGDDLAGKTILLNYEMGLGDAINFVRYVPLVAHHAARVILECQTPLRELFESVDGADEVITLERDGAVPAYDVHCSLMRLPQLFGSDCATIPREVPYLRPSPARLEKWRQRIGPERSRRRVGLVWAGSPQHQNDRQRSIPLERLWPLALAADVEFFSLQKGPAAAQAKSPPSGMRLIDHASGLENMADTAALIEQLDLVICVDTSVAHLAGSLGKPTWVLLAFVPDWRWMLDRVDTPWYPQMRLFRQPALGDWQTPIDRIAERLERGDCL